MEQDVKAFWEREAPQERQFAYHYYSNPENLRYPYYEVRRDRVLELLDGLPIGRLLDAGCGGGAILIESLKRGWDGYGCDFAENMVAWAQEDLSKNDFNPNRVLKASITSLNEYSDKSFDAIVSLGVMEYLNENEERLAFDEFSRILKDSGTLIIENINALFDLTTFNRFTVRFFQQHFFPKFFQSPGEINSLTTDLRELVRFPEKPDTEGKYSTTMDQVFCKSEIPFEYDTKMRRYGFYETDQVFYRFHSAPPLLFENRPELEVRSIDFEKQYSRHWIGYFLATGFISVLKKTERQ